jgi:hypothetical protein
MIQRIIPKSSLFRVVAVKFAFDFQTSGIYAGKYLCTDNEEEILKMKTNTVYLIESASVSGSIPEEVFVNSVVSSSFLSFHIKRLQRSQLVTSEPVLISQYYKEKNISMHTDCNQNNDGLKICIAGVLNQVAETVGLSSISLVVSLSTYEIDGELYNRQFRDLDYRS